MKPSSCASRSELALALVSCLWIAGCAAAPRAPLSEPVEAAPADPAPGSVVDLEFSNGSAKASISVDLSQTDVQLDMRTRAKRDSTPPSRAAVATLPGASGVPAAAPTAAASPDSVTRAVVAGIRRGQELFLKGEFAAAQEAVGGTLALRSTAEAHALAGSIAWVRGDATGARDHWQTSLRLDPDQPGVADILERTAADLPTPEPGKVPAR